MIMRGPGRCVDNSLDEAWHCRRSQENKKPAQGGLFIFGVPNRIRTGVTAVKGRCPRPLDDGDSHVLLRCCKIDTAQRLLALRDLLLNRH